jgi:hypothetical protein
MGAYRRANSSKEASPIPARPAASPGANAGGEQLPTIQEGRATTVRHFEHLDR